MNNLLDDLEAMKKLDSMGAFDALWELPGQCESAYRLPDLIDLPEVEAISQIIVTGLGGSAIGGDLLRLYAGPRLNVPVLVNRDYRLPAFTGKDTLVFCVSYSGNTEETLSAYEDARKRKAAIIAITSGGKLKEKALSDGYPVISVPGGISPRSATGYLFLPTLKVLERLGLLPGQADEISELVSHLRSLREKIGPAAPWAGNPAKKLASRFYGKLPVIWGVSGTTEVVAMRFKGQINENAKAPAYWNVLPELNHNEIVGTQVPDNVLKSLELIVLRDPQDHTRVNLRVDITRRIVQDRVSGITELMAEGPGQLTRLYDLIYKGDYASVYLACLYGIDPGPVQVIDRLKGELAGM